MRALALKRWRDAWHYRGQLAAIALVMLAGMALFVSLRSMHGWLSGSRDAYYRDTRFGDVFASVGRAPSRAAADIARLPGVHAVDTRIVQDVVLDVRGLDEPATGRLVSIPVPRAPMLNALTLTRGTWPDARHPDEVLVSQGFARANALVPGDAIDAILNGQWRRLRITGMAISPEFVYEVGAASFFPDNRRFGAIWMGADALAAAFAMRGAFNDVVVAVSPHVAPAAVVGAVDSLLARYGGRGASLRRDQISDQFLSGEIDETQVTSLLLPGIFLAVTAFLLHMVLSRLVATQRDQLATLKAFGYGNAAIGWHYASLALIPIVIGGVLGTLVGVGFGTALAGIYARFFQFPAAPFVQDPRIVVQGFTVSLVAGLAGAIAAVRRGVAIPPAEAMRPDAPARYRPGILNALGVRPAPQVQVIVRHLERRPVKALLTLAGLAVAGGLVITSLGMFDTVTYMKEVQFYLTERADATVAFAGATASSGVGQLQRMPGVLEVEPFRVVPVRLSTPTASYRTSLLALEPDARLRAIVGLDARRHRPPPVGVLLARPLADTLGISEAGDVTVEVLEGARHITRLPVAGIVEDLFGMGAYMNLAGAGALTGGAVTHSGAWIRVDPRQAPAVFAALKRVPKVAGVSARTAALAGFERTIAESFRIALATTLGFACIIAFGIVYNSGRITLSERARELASLRVLGFTRRETGVMLVGEQVVLTLLSLPVAALVARGLAWLIEQRFESTLFRLPVVIAPASHLLGSGVVVLAAAGSAVLILRRVNRLDLVRVLKTRE